MVTRELTKRAAKKHLALHGETIEYNLLKANVEKADRRARKLLRKNGLRPKAEISHSIEFPAMCAVEVLVDLSGERREYTADEQALLAMYSVPLNNLLKVL